MLTRQNTKQSKYIDHMKENNDSLRAKLKLYKDRERRDKEAAEAALREA